MFSFHYNTNYPTPYFHVIGGVIVFLQSVDYMKYFGFIICVFILILSACSKNELLLVGMNASFMEQFSSVCDGDSRCIEVAETYADICFDNDLGLKAIEANNKMDKKAINSDHILKYKNCLAKESGTEYWSNLDMVSYILGQVG